MLLINFIYFLDSVKWLSEIKHSSLKLTEKGFHEHV